MFYDNFRENVKDWFKLKLEEDKTYITLDDMHGAVMWFPESREIVEKYGTVNILQAREKTLRYIQTLLEQGNLKARRFIYVERPARTEEEKKANTIFYDIAKTIEYKDVDETIRDIGEAWNNTAREDLALFEMSVQFTLTDTHWSAV